jgi:hypothetical protein
LRIQFLCEYRYHLQEKFGNPETRASIEGSRLHDIVATSDSTIQDRHQMIPIIIIIAVLIIGYLWIFG